MGGGAFDTPKARREREAAKKAAKKATSKQTALQRIRNAITGGCRGGGRHNYKLVELGESFDVSCTKCGTKP